MISPNRLSVVVSTYNQIKPLRIWLAAMRMQSIQPLEILIADDGSTSETSALIHSISAAFACPVRHIWHEDRGFRKNVILNRSLSAAAGEYVVLTDADCVPHPKFVEDHARLAEKGFWVQGRRCYLSQKASESLQPGQPVPSLRFFLTGHLSGAMKGFRLPAAVIRRDVGNRGIIGCNMGMWRDDLLALNGWDEEYEGWGLGEDSDVGVRLYHLGRRRKFVYGRAIIYHLHHPILSRDHMPVSLARFEETLSRKKVRCDRGVDQYLQNAENGV
jgi:glycosyltransferase involved in cell wall biosynthesis